MGLFDIYNIENYHGSSSQAHWWIPSLTALGSIFIAFFLKYFFDKKDDKKRINRAGTSYESLISSFEEPIRNHINSLEKYIKESRGVANSTVEVTTVHRFADIRTFDRSDLIKYFEKKHSDNAVSHINKIGNAILIIENQIVTMEKLIFENYPNSVNKLVAKYRDKFNEVQIAAFRYEMFLSDKKKENNAAIIAYRNLVKKYFMTRFSPHYITSLIGTLHKDLQDKLFHQQDEFYIILQQFNVQGGVIANEIENAKKLELAKVASSVSNLKRAYRRLYNKDVAPVTPDSDIIKRENHE